MSNPYDFTHSVPSNYVLSEQDKKELLNILIEEFGVEVKFEYIDDLKKECDSVYEQFRQQSDDIYDDSLMLKLIDRMSEIRYQMVGSGLVVLKRKGYEYQQRWNYLWNNRHPLATFKEICVYELNITHFDGSKLDHACRHLHKRKMKHLNNFL